MLLGIVRLGNFKANWIAWAIAIITVAAVMIGALQIASGNPASSPWYFYEITNFGFATGFFSNANHMATLLVVTIPFLDRLVHERAGEIALQAELVGDVRDPRRAR